MIASTAPAATAKLDLRDRAHAVVWAHDAGLRAGPNG
jgi:hypothetical protein